MKILAISQTSANHTGKIQIKKNNYSYPVINKNSNANDILAQMQSMANTNIPFTGNDFKATVRNNYFQLSRGANPDNFQLAAAQNIYLGNDVLVTAPTGTGKTAIAHYAMTNNLKNGKKTFYTTPLKALSNEKFRDFQKIYGKENVGILTGDTKINKDAPIIIMTTEVYRNMVFGETFGNHNDLLDGLKTVIFDELHYLGDVDRGGIWEQSIFLSDPDTQLLSLSATIGNNKDIAHWMANTKRQITPEIVSGNNSELRNYRASETEPVHTVLIDVPPSNRHVPLEFNNITVSHLKKPEASNKKSKFNAQIEKLDKLASRKDIIPAYVYNEVVQTLKSENKLPAIFFVFDKKNSKDILEHLTKYGPKLTTDDEREEILDILEKYEENNQYLGESLNIKALLKGYAVHNAGLLPTQKELVEELFQKKLVKTVIATETLSAGINMPTRTTVITATRKPSSTPDAPDNKRSLTPNEFHQMAGRAGRRGIDEIGYCYTLSLDEAQEAQFQKLISSNPNNIKSALKPDYSFIAKYYANCNNNELINLICEKSLFTYNKNEKIAENKKQNLKRIFNRKIGIMKELHYIHGNTLSNKGKLIANLNGYEQIPIIEMVSSKAFKNMDAVELAAAVSALANIDLQAENKNNFGLKGENTKSFYHRDEKLTQYMTELNKTIKLYNELTKDETVTPMKLELNNDLTKNIYEWAALNANNEDSILNWGKLYYNSDKRTYKDEGSMFKGIMMTIDLLKQLHEVCETGINISKSQDEYDYYTNLKDKIKEALDLINREPASNSI